MFTLSPSRVTNDAKQAIVSGCKGFEKKDTKGFFLLMACYCLKTAECEQRLCFFSAGTLKETLRPVCMWQKMYNSHVENDLVYCKSSIQQAQWCNISTNQGWNCWLKRNGQVGVMQILLHAFCISVKSSLHYRYTHSIHMCPLNTLCFKRLHELAQLVLLWFKTGVFADSWKQTQYIE